MITVITGGSGSGKSAFAEDYLLSLGEGKRIYIATMEPYGKEGARRIARHRQLREGKGFVTRERYTDLAGLAVPEGSFVLLECMSNLVANEMFRPDGAGEGLVEAVLLGVQRLEARCREVCIVTNEISGEYASYQGETVRYQQYLGRVNQTLGQMAHRVVQVVYGVPVYWKGAPKDAVVEQF